MFAMDRKGEGAYYSPITISSSSSSDESGVACKVEEEKNGEVESAVCRSNYDLFRPTNELLSTRLDPSCLSSPFANFLGSKPMSRHQNAHLRQPVLKDNRSRVCPPMILCVPYCPQRHCSTPVFPSYGSTNNILGVNRSHSGIQKPYYGRSFSSSRYGHSGWSKSHFSPKPLLNSANNYIGLSMPKTVSNANYRASSMLLGRFSNNAVAGMMQYANNKPTTIGDGNGAKFSVESNHRIWEGGREKKFKAEEDQELDLTLKL
ncbi:hypothetical protein FRX31_002693 [Thalictrum thalictroides]|uniref:Uncharacterized protein n=1 Tax=Thalictrum thalictroides TaxID=46969 RepID=A0A7J6XFH7_THATH|nr:hypothetical protein FRX31_002693 [Thalictrum thalictroides]